MPYKFFQFMKKHPVWFLVVLKKFTKCTLTNEAIAKRNYGKSNRTICFWNHSESMKVEMLDKLDWYISNYVIHFSRYTYISKLVNRIFNIRKIKGRTHVPLSIFIGKGLCWLYFAISSNHFYASSSLLLIFLGKFELRTICFLEEWDFVENWAVSTRFHYSLMTFPAVMVKLCSVCGETVE